MEYFYCILIRIHTYAQKYIFFLFDSGQFRTIKGINESLNAAVLAWQNNWVTFIDGILQLNVLRQPYGSVSLPSRIRRISINVKEHMNIIDDSRSSDNIFLMPAKIMEHLDKTM